MTTKRITSKAFADALNAARQPNRPVMAVAVDMRITTDDLRQLDPEQVKAVFEGVGKLVALGVAR